MDTQYAESKITAPAIGLIVTAVSGMLLQLISAALNVFTLLGGTAVAINEGADGIGLLANGAVGLGLNVFALITGVVVLIGALKMKNLSSHGFAMAAAVIAMIPCVSPCCLLGLPLGIWALMALSDPEVKAAFNREESY